MLTRASHKLAESRNAITYSSRDHGEERRGRDGEREKEGGYGGCKPRLIGRLRSEVDGGWEKGVGSVI